MNHKDIMFDYGSGHFRATNLKTGEVCKSEPKCLCLEYCLPLFKQWAFDVFEMTERTNEYIRTRSS